MQDPIIRQEIFENILEVQLRDVEKGHWLQSDGAYRQDVPETEDEVAEAPFNSQAWFMNGRTTLLQPQMVEVGD